MSPSNESHEFFFVAELIPIQPTDFVVLTVSIVVPLLGAAEFVAGEEHGNSLGQEKGCEEVSLLPCPERR